MKSNGATRVGARITRLGMGLLGLLLAACGAPRTSARPSPAAGGLPPIPPVSGPLRIDLVYPGEGQTIGGAVDSTFVFGNVGTGGASLTINNAPVPVEPNGAFLAFLPVPASGRYELAATANGQTERLTRTVQRPAPPAAQPAAPATPAPVPAAAAPATASDTAVQASPFPRTAVVRSTRADQNAVGTAVAGSGTPYQWFFPNTTRLSVVGQQGGQYRVQLTRDLSVWVDSSDVELLPAGTPAPTGAVGTVAATPRPDYIDIRLTTSQRLPFQVDPSERGLTVTVFGAETRTNIMLYGAEDPLLQRMEWEPTTDELYRLRVELSEPLWGYQPFWDAGGNLVIRVRRPPTLDAANPLRGLYLGIDAGHPPGGAIGPTRLTEAEATLAVTKQLIPMLRARGARVLEIRPDMSPVALGTRPQMATDSSVHLLVSVHFDAFGDGVNPFENHGTHVFYNQPQSLDLARTIQRELLQELGLRDLGISRRDLALVRPTWMPSVLTESAFMMIPRNEAALRDPRVIQRIAEAHLRGIEAFLRQRAGEQAR